MLDDALAQLEDINGVDGWVPDCTPILDGHADFIGWVTPVRTFEIDSSTITELRWGNH